MARLGLLHNLMALGKDLGYLIGWGKVFGLFLFGRMKGFRYFGKCVGVVLEFIGWCWAMRVSEGSAL